MPKRKLRAEQCVPCSTGDKLGFSQRLELRKEVPAWGLAGDRIARDLTFKDFATALRFADAVGRIAEREDHHPDLHLTGYKHLRIELTTHAARGLTRNDFILAAKVEHLLATPKWRHAVTTRGGARPRRSRPGSEATYPVPPL